MVISCCAVGCNNRQDKNSGIPFHRFPKDPDRRVRWISAIRRKNWNPGNYARVCGEHFICGIKNDNPLSPDYVPSIFTFLTSPSKKKKVKEMENFTRRQEAKRRRRQLEPSANKSGDHENCSKEPNQWQNPDNNSDVSCVAYGCNKRQKKYRKELRSDSEGSEDEESELKRKYPRQFHLFPNEPQLLKQWIVNIRRKDWFPNPGSKICSDHFKEEVLDKSGSIVRLKKNAVPTRFKALKKLLTYDGNSKTCSVKLEPPKLMNIKQEP